MVSLEPLVCYCFPLQIGWLLVEWDSPWTSYSVSYSLSHSQQWPVGTILQQHSLSHTHSILLLHCLDCSGTNGHSSPHSQTTNRAAVSASWDKKVITSSLNNQPSQDNVCIQWTLTIIPDTSSGAVKFVLINELFTFQCCNMHWRWYVYNGVTVDWMYYTNSVHTEAASTDSYKIVKAMAKLSHSCACSIAVTQLIKCGKIN